MRIANVLGRAALGCAVFHSILTGCVKPPPDDGSSTGSTGGASSSGSSGASSAGNTSGGSSGQTGDGCIQGEPCVRFLKDLSDDPTDDVKGFFTYRGALHFSVLAQPAWQVWRTDGTATGTQVAFAPPRDPGDSTVFSLPTVFNDRVYYLRDPPTPGWVGKRLMQWDGTQFTEVLAAGLQQFHLSATPGGVVFGRAGNVSGVQLTEFDTQVVSSTGVATLLTNEQCGSATFAVASPGRVLLGCDPGTIAGGGQRVNTLWVSDGTTAGTTPAFSAADAAAQNLGWQLSEGVAMEDGRFVFPCSAGKVCVSDGTQAGTRILTSALTRGVVASGFVALGNTVYFTARTDTAGVEPWRTDGTAAGTFMLADTNPGTSGAWLRTIGRSSDAERLEWIAPISNNRAVFAVENGTRALWVTDGTVAGTRQLAPLSSTPTTRFLSDGTRAYWSSAPPSGETSWLGWTDGVQVGRVRSPLPHGTVESIAQANGLLLMFGPREAAEAQGIWVISPTGAPVGSSSSGSGGTSGTGSMGASSGGVTSSSGGSGAPSSSGGGASSGGGPDGGAPDGGAPDGGGTPGNCAYGRQFTTPQGTTTVVSDQDDNLFIGRRPTNGPAYEYSRWSCNTGIATTFTGPVMDGGYVQGPMPPSPTNSSDWFVAGVDFYPRGNRPASWNRYSVSPTTGQITDAWAFHPADGNTSPAQMVDMNAASGMTAGQSVAVGNVSVSVPADHFGPAVDVTVTTYDATVFGCRMRSPVAVITTTARVDVAFTVANVADGTRLVSSDNFLDPGYSRWTDNTDQGTLVGNNLTVQISESALPFAVAVVAAACTHVDLYDSGGTQYLMERADHTWVGWATTRSGSSELWFMDRTGLLEDVFPLPSGLGLVPQPLQRGVMLTSGNTLHWLDGPPYPAPVAGAAGCHVPLASAPANVDVDTVSWFGCDNTPTLYCGLCTPWGHRWKVDFTRNQGAYPRFWHQWHRRPGRRW